MKQVKETKIITFLRYDELTEERQKEEYEKALKDDFLHDMFSDDFYRQYKDDLEEIQTKHDLHLEPKYTNGSQHGLLGFQNKDYNNEIIFYKGIYFYLKRQKHTKYKVLFNYDDDNTEENKNILEEIQTKVNAFIDDFINMYSNYEEYFMYGYCQAYEDFVKDFLQYDDEERYETHETLESVVI